MKNFAIRVAAVVGFALALIAPGGEFGQTGALAWSVLLSLTFAYVAMSVAKASAFFVLSIVALLTVVFPLAVLLAIGYPIQHSLTGTAAALMASLSEQPLQSLLQFALPAVVVAVTARRLCHVAQVQESRPRP